MDNNVIFDERREGLNAFYNKVYGLMGIGVLMSAIVAYLMIGFFPTNLLSMLSNMGYGIMLVLLIPVFLVIPMQRSAMKNSSMALPLFIAFSAINGFVLSFTLLYYTAANVAIAFVTASGMFLGLSLYGRVTKRDLSGMGKAFGMAVWGLLLALILNFFFHSTGFTFIVSIIGVIVFSGLIAWDNQKIEKVYNSANGQVQEGWAISMALLLYLDFINLFLFLLRIFGIGSSRN